MKTAQRVLSLALCFMIAASAVSVPSVAYADWDDLGLYTQDCVDKWLGTRPFGGWNLVDAADALFSYKKYSSSKPQKYYTTPYQQRTRQKWQRDELLSGRRHDYDQYH